MEQFTQSYLDQLVEGEPISHSLLEIIPLFGPPSGPEVTTLTEALVDGSVEVNEVSDSGSVPRIRVFNKGARLLLILDGEEVIGAKQNRILNTSVLIGPKSEVHVPVSCIEHGRWRRNSNQFSSKERVMPASLRKAKSSRVSYCLDAGAGYDADQDAVWDDVKQYNRSKGVRSPTGALSDALDHDDDRVEAFVKALRPQEGQIGLVAYVGCHLAGADLFANPQNYRAAHDRIIRSHAFDALICEDNGQKAKPMAQLELFPRHFLKAALSGEPRSTPSPGLGTDLRYRHAGIEAALLEYQNELVHLVAYPA